MPTLWTIIPAVPKEWSKGAVIRRCRDALRHPGPRPADLAGIKAGDILKKIGTCEVKEVYSYMDCLSKVNSGDELPVTVIRDGKEMTLNVKF